MSGFALSIGKGRSGSRGELKKASIITAGLEPPTLRRGTSDDVDSLAVIEERLGSLCDCISRDVVPGLERELGQVSPWMRMWRCRWVRTHVPTFSVGVDQHAYTLTKPRSVAGWRCSTLPRAVGRRPRPPRAQRGRRRHRRRAPPRGTTRRSAGRCWRGRSWRR